jgi:hypothetical protein
MDGCSDVIELVGKCRRARKGNRQQNGDSCEDIISE